VKFLSKKEQVIDLEITPYGKSLLSKGRFMPMYYAFFDDSVLYDSQYGEFSEHQNSASVRIKDAFQLETQAFFYSAESQVRQAVEYIRFTDEEKERADAYGLRPVDLTNKAYVEDDNVTIGAIPDQEFDGTPIGNSALNSSYAPAWNVNVIEGIISSSTSVLPGLNLPIPQMNMTGSLFKFEIANTPTGNNVYEFGDLADNPLRGKFLNVLGESIILEIAEDNTEYEWENFDIEVFEVESVMFDKAQPIGFPLCTPEVPPGTVCPEKVTKEFLTPLFFMENVNQIQNEVLLDFDEIPDTMTPLDSRYAGYYFDISVDGEIQEKLLCGKAHNKPDGLYSQRTIACADEQKQQKVDITGLYEGNDGECPEEDE